MEQYIPKSVLLAEIERLITPENGYSMDKLLDFIDTLETKDVDLDKEIDLVEDKYHGFESLSRADIIDVARHFFELGLKARIDKELVEEVYSHIDSIKDTADRMTSGNFMHHKAAIKFSANTIAKVLELMSLEVAQKGEKI